MVTLDDVGFVSAVSIVCEKQGGFKDKSFLVSNYFKMWAKRVKRVLSEFM